MDGKGKDICEQVNMNHVTEEKGKSPEKIMQFNISTEKVEPKLHL